MLSVTYKPLMLSVFVMIVVMMSDVMLSVMAPLPNIMFVFKAGAYPSEAPFRRSTFG